MSELAFESPKPKAETSLVEREIPKVVEKEIPSLVESSKVEIVEPEPQPKENQIKKIIKEYKPKMDDATAESYSNLIETHSNKHGIDPIIIVAMVWQESRFDRKAVSSHDAIGLMQILPSTARPYGVTRSQLFNPETNISLGVEYLAYLREYFDGDLRLAIIAYNQGMGNVRRGTYKTWYYRDVHEHYHAMESLVN